ncbi:bone morphogenetic protein 7 [Lasius niger]|uniref:Bone morphogenetic protein 7 n=1 Tax=Lasius niger TaxID=67767 RepID=A0A0J7KTK5_LASNI|nr:bone morphogenetic protein 7 [Lasius niger]
MIRFRCGGIQRQTIDELLFALSKFIVDIICKSQEHPGNRSSVNWKGGNHRHFLYFPVTVSDDTEDVTVDHASLRFLLQGDHRRPRDLEVLVYLRTPISRRLLLRRKISQIQTTDSRWLELDFTEAVAGWLERNLDNHGLELEFLHDGRPTRRDISYTTLNVFTALESGGRRKRSTPEELMSLHKGRRSKCKGDNNKKCCRHELTVMFKDLEGFEFIVFPKGFDAGYCKGRCPPRYNPAHHHALLQSLLWKEDRKRVPKPCCAPSKLDQLMILYFDENDSTRLKVSYWKSIQVLECACS